MLKRLCCFVPPVLLPPVYCPVCFVRVPVLEEENRVPANDLISGFNAGADPANMPRPHSTMVQMQMLAIPSENGD